MKDIAAKFVCVLLSFTLLGNPVIAGITKGGTGISREEIEAVTGFDDAEVYGNLEGLVALDEYLEANPSKSLSDVYGENFSVLKGVSSLSSFPQPGNNTVRKPFGIPSFLWGLVFGFVGFTFVYIYTDGDPQEVRKAGYGCAIPTVAAGLYVSYVLIFSLRVLNAMSESDF